MAELDKKRYILFSKDDGRPDSEKPCAFFISAAGCKNGSKCRFMHESKSTKPTIHQENVIKTKAPQQNNIETRLQIDKPSTILTTEKKVSTSTSNSNAIIQQLQQQLLEQQRLIDSAQSNLARENETKKLEKKRKSIDNKPKEESPKYNQTKKQFISNETFNVQQPYVAHVINNNSYLNSIQSNNLLNQPNKIIKTNAVEESNYDYDDEDDDKNIFLESVVNHVLDIDNKQNSSKQFFQPQTANTQFQSQFTSIKDVVQKPLEPVLIMASPFVSADDAIKALQSSGSAHAIHGSAKKNIFAQQKLKSTVNVQSNIVLLPKVTKLPFNPSIGSLKNLAWNQLVELTKSNPRYVANYTFSEDATWIRSKTYGSWCVEQSIPEVISLDCEMCETTDPVNGAKCENALIRLSILDLFGKVLVDSLITPGLPITDARTHIHGITEKQLQSATWTLRHAQAALLNLCSERTIIVGHSIHKDLKALRFNHSKVIDTAYLYTIENEPGAAPSLRG